MDATRLLVLLAALSAGQAAAAPEPVPGGDPALAGTVGAAPAPSPVPSPGASTPAPGAMVAVPGGRFRAGERVGVLDDTYAYYRVAPFLLDATEVTVAEYGACVRAGRCAPAATTVRWDGLPAGERGRWSAACNGERGDRADHPVNCVDWFQARDYCAFAGKRLPSEAEWEWAARGGAAGTSFPWGDEPPGDRACWSGEGNLAGGPLVGTCPVASHPRGATRTGILDLAGNVWEWTDTADLILTDSRGRGGTRVRIARGGGWADSAPGRLRAALRAKDLPGDRAADLGFRCARDR